MGIGFCVLLKFSLEVNAWVRNLKGADSSGNIRGDVCNTLDLGQIASDRGGTAASVHVRDFEAHKRRDR